VQLKLRELQKPRRRRRLLRNKLLRRDGLAMLKEPKSRRRSVSSNSEKKRPNDDDKNVELRNGRLLLLLRLVVLVPSMEIPLLRGDHVLLRRQEILLLPRLQLPPLHRVEPIDLPRPEQYLQHSLPEVEALLLLRLFRPNHLPLAMRAPEMSRRVHNLPSVVPSHVKNQCVLHPPRKMPMDFSQRVSGNQGAGVLVRHHHGSYNLMTVIYV